MKTKKQLKKRKKLLALVAVTEFLRQSATHHAEELVDIVENHIKMEGAVFEELVQVVVGEVRKMGEKDNKTIPELLKHFGEFCEANPPKKNTRISPTDVKQPPPFKPENDTDEESDDA